MIASLPRKQYGIRFDTDLMRRVDIAAKRSGVERTTFLEALIEHGLNNGLPEEAVIARARAGATSRDKRLTGADRAAAFRRATQR